jgi:hypothetical protein
MTPVQAAVKEPRKSTRCVEVTHEAPGTSRGLSE